MKPIQEQEWLASGRNVVDGGCEQVAACFGTHGTEVAKAFAALPKVLRAMIDLGGTSPEFGWHSALCWEQSGIERRRGWSQCVEECAVAREALSACGVDVN